MTIIASAPVPARFNLIEAPTADLAAVRRPADPAAVARQALLDARRPIADVAAQLGVTETEAVDLAVDDIARQTGWTAGVGRRPAHTDPGSVIPCPAWCTRDHTEDTADRMHYRHLGELTAPAGDDMHEQKFISVELEQLAAPDLPGGIDPALIYFTMGAQGGNEIESSANLSPELAEQLAAALFEAARIARQARR